MYLQRSKMDKCCSASDSEFHGDSEEHQLSNIKANTFCTHKDKQNNEFNKKIRFTKSMFNRAYLKKTKLNTFISLIIFKLMPRFGNFLTQVDD